MGCHILYEFGQRSGFASGFTVESSSGLVPRLPVAWTVYGNGM